MLTSTRSKTLKKCMLLRSSFSSSVFNNMEEWYICNYNFDFLTFTKSRMISCLSGIRSIFYIFLHMLVHNKMLTKPKTMFTKPKMLLLKATIWNPRILLKPTVWCLICHGYKVVNTKMYRLLAVIKVETGMIASIILSDNWGDLFLLNKFQHCGQSIDRENIPPHRKTINYRYINSQNCI